MQKGLEQEDYPRALHDAGHRGRVLEFHAVPAVADAVGGLVHVHAVDQGCAPGTSACVPRPLKSALPLCLHHPLPPARCRPKVLRSHSLPVGFRPPGSPGWQYS